MFSDRPCRILHIFKWAGNTEHYTSLPAHQSPDFIGGSHSTATTPFIFNCSCRQIASNLCSQDLYTGIYIYWPIAPSEFFQKEPLLYIFKTLPQFFHLLHAPPSLTLRLKLVSQREEIQEEGGKIFFSGQYIYPCIPCSFIGHPLHLDNLDIHHLLHVFVQRSGPSETYMESLLQVSGNLAPRKVGRRKNFNLREVFGFYERSFYEKFF